MGFLRANRFSCLTAVKVVLQQSDRIYGPYPRIRIHRSTGLNLSNNPMDMKFTDYISPVKCQYMWVAVTFM